MNILPFATKSFAVMIVFVTLANKSATVACQIHRYTYLLTYIVSILGGCFSLVGSSRRWMTTTIILLTGADYNGSLVV